MTRKAIIGNATIKLTPKDGVFAVSIEIENYGPTVREHPNYIDSCHDFLQLIAGELACYADARDQKAVENLIPQ